MGSRARPAYGVEPTYGCLSGLSRPPRVYKLVVYMTHAGRALGAPVMHIMSGGFSHGCVCKSWVLSREASVLRVERFSRYGDEGVQH